MKEGILIVDKPGGMTSHDVVARVRREFGMRRVGHAGTLDPLATGVLIILLGPSTKLFNKFVGFDKAYKATLRLGVATTSADIEGQVLQTAPYAHIPEEQIRQAFDHFIGEYDQVPPMVSAVKHRGKKLYQLARKGITVERKPRRVRVDLLRITQMTLPDIKFYLECSKGTYVRQLAEDIGNRLMCGACITQIERTKVGPFTIDEAVKLEDVHESCIRSWQN